MKKKSGDSTKNSEILFFGHVDTIVIAFPRWTYEVQSMRRLGTRHQPHSQGLLPFQDGRQTEKNKLLNTSKNRSSMQKSNKYIHTSYEKVASLRKWRHCMLTEGQWIWANFLTEDAVLSIRAGSRPKQSATGQSLAGYFRLTLMLILVGNLK